MTQNGQRRSKSEVALLRPADHIAVIEMRRPPHNFFDDSLIGQIADAYETLDADPQIRAVVLAAQGRSFCAGAQFNAGAASSGPGDVPALYAQAARLFAGVKPLIAAVQGPAVGGGFGLALAADFRIAAPQARFWANFVQLGFHPGFALTQTLPRLIGPQKAALLMLTARRLSGSEALAWGIADALAPADQLREAALALAAEIAAQAPLAVAATRASLRRSLAAQAARAMKHEWEQQARLAQTRDHQEGVRAVAERRPGRFTGR